MSSDAKGDGRIDAYIAKAQPFAQPLLSHVRERVHAVAPGVQETTKWSAPAFTIDGKILLIMAAFKQHAALNFWRGQELRGNAANSDAMGQFGKLKSVDDLPPDAELDRLIGEAAELAKSAPAPRKVKQAEASRHASSGFAKARNAAPKARALDGPAERQRLFSNGSAKPSRTPRDQSNRHRNRMAERGQTSALEVSKL